MDCNKLREIKGLNKFKTSNVKNMTYMFNNCSELEYLDLSNFDTSNVTDISYMSHMFDGCNKLKEIKGKEKFNKNIKNN